MKTITEVRESFWVANPMAWTKDEIANVKRSKKRQNDYPCDIRCAFVDYVESLSVDGVIKQSLANRVTL
jgi:hypothetical protein